MHKSPSASFIIIILAMILLFISCTDAPKTSNVSQIAVTSISDSADTSKTEPNTIEGYLDILYISKTVFTDDSIKRVVLKYFINVSGKLTLKGWKRIKVSINPEDEEYDPNAFELTNGTPTTISFGKKSFFGWSYIK